jgi:3-dehydrosphinganine reductase
MRSRSAVKVMSVVMDVSDEKSVAAAVAEVRQWGGDIDVLVCNAGYSVPSRFLDIPNAQGQGMMDVNFFGCVNVVRAVVGRMYERKQGRVVLVSSMAGMAPVAGFTLYGPTKAAVRAFAQSLDMESASRGVRVQVVNPPDVATPGYAEENKTKSEECKQICAMGGTKPMSAGEFAKGVVSQIERYSFQVNVGFDANMLAIGCAGMDPPSDPVRLLLEVTLGGVMRLVAAVYVYLHYGIVRSVHKKEGIAK